MQWIINEFLPYLDNWEKSVESQSGFTNGGKKRMMLSCETFLGLRMTDTVYS